METLDSTIGMVGIGDYRLVYIDSHWKTLL